MSTLCKELHFLWEEHQKDVVKMTTLSLSPFSQGANNLRKIPCDKSGTVQMKRKGMKVFLLENF